jgi:hypothetical protein
MLIDTNSLVSGGLAIHQAEKARAAACVMIYGWSGCKFNAKIVLSHSSEIPALLNVI